MKLYLIIKVTEWISESTDYNKAKNSVSIQYYIFVHVIISINGTIGSVELHQKPISSKQRYPFLRWARRGKKKKKVCSQRKTNTVWYHFTGGMKISLWYHFTGGMKISQTHRNRIREQKGDYQGLGNGRNGEMVVKRYKTRSGDWMYSMVIIANNTVFYTREVWTE